MAILNPIASNWSRSEREKLNNNWIIIERYLSNLQGQINLLTGDVDVQALIDQINDIINQGNVVVEDLEAALQDASTVIANARNATTSANNAAQEAQSAIDNMQAFINQFGNAESYDNSKLYKINNLVELDGSGFICIKDTQGNSPPTLPTKRNEWWQLFAQKGLDGTGAVSKVAGKSPELDGNVPLTAQDVGAASITEFNAHSAQTNAYIKATSGIVVVGDSLAKGDDGQSYKGHANISDWLKYFTRYQVSNKGIFGNTLSDIILRLETDVIALRPAHCIVLAGTNDINNNDEVAVMLDNVQTIINNLLANRINVIFISIPPRNDNLSLNAKIRHYNRQLESLCIYNNCHFVDVYSHLCNQNGSAKNGILSTVDNLHWISQGAYEASKIIEPSIPKLSNYKDIIYSRFFDAAYENFEFATSRIVEGVGTLAHVWEAINTAGASFSIETNPNTQTNGTQSNYQVITKSNTTLGAAGIYQTSGAYQAGKRYRTELDVEWEMTGDIDTETFLTCKLVLSNGTTTSESTFVQSYNLLNAKFRPFVDIDIPQDTTSVTLEVFGTGTSQFKLKVGRVVAYKI